MVEGTQEKEDNNSSHEPTTIATANLERGNPTSTDDAGHNDSSGISFHDGECHCFGMKQNTFFLHKKMPNYWALTQVFFICTGYVLTQVFFLLNGPVLCR